MLPSDFFRFLGFKGRPRAVPMGKQSGITKTTGPYGEIVDADTLQCVHCCFTWEVVAGSGIERGFCSQCCDYTCGKPECMVCIPFEQRLTNRESGLPELTPRAPQVAVLEVPGVIKAKPMKLILP